MLLNAKSTIYDCLRFVERHACQTCVESVGQIFHIVRKWERAAPEVRPESASRDGSIELYDRNHFPARFAQ